MNILTLFRAFAYTDTSTLSFMLDIKHCTIFVEYEPPCIKDIQVRFNYTISTISMLSVSFELECVTPLSLFSLQFYFYHLRQETFFVYAIAFGCNVECRDTDNVAARIVKQPSA